jgi:hypothetical protein
MCKKSRESINHLLLYYEVARGLWALVFLSFWDGVGNAPMGGRVISKLERTLW